MPVHTLIRIRPPVAEPVEQPLEATPPECAELGALLGGLHQERLEQDRRRLEEIARLRELRDRD